MPGFVMTLKSGNVAQVQLTQPASAEDIQQVITVLERLRANDQAAAAGDVEHCLECGRAMPGAVAGVMICDQCGGTFA